MVVSRAVKPVVWSRQASENISSVSLKPVLGCKIVPCKEIKVETVGQSENSLSLLCIFTSSD